MNNCPRNQRKKVGKEVLNFPSGPVTGAIVVVDHEDISGMLVCVGFALDN